MNPPLYAFCDLAHTPASFDFVTWLVRAMKERDERGCDGLHVVFVPNENDPHAGGLRKWGKHDADATLWRFWHICIASLPLARATMTLAPDRRFAEYICGGSDAQPNWWPEGKAHFMGPLVEASRRGVRIPRLEATEQARNYISEWIRTTASGPLVTVTVRNQTTDPDRNTSGAMWEFAAWVQKEHRFPVIILGEADEVLRNGEGKFAILDPDLRLALYERAVVNIIGNNGPQELLKFSRAPYLAFGQAMSEGWKDHWRKYFSMEPGQQLPWAAANQRLIYKADTLENLKEEFLRVCYDTQP